MKTRKIHGGMVVLLCLLATVVVGGTTARAAEKAPTTIHKIYWIIHPYCWSMYSSVPAECDTLLWYKVLAWELQAHARHLDLVRNLKPDEALIIYPIGSSEPMSRLIKYAQETLGRRCIVQTWAPPDPLFLSDLTDPLRQFVDNPNLAGRSEWLHAVLTNNGAEPYPEQVAAELEAEIRAGCEAKGYDLGMGAIEVIGGNRAFALDLAGKMKAQGWSFDPQTVECVACGEGFEECAMTWKAMLPKYLGLAKPIENDFNFSVSGAAVLVGSTLKERLDLGNNVRLFLWTGEQGQPVALFAKAAVVFSDPQLYTLLPLAGHSWELRDVGNNQLWPATDKTPSSIRAEGEYLRAPVLAGVRQSGDATCYITCSGMSYEGFRAVMVAAALTAD